MKLTEAQADIAGQLVATWVSQQMRLREIMSRSFGRFETVNGIPIFLAADYWAPEALRPRVLVPSDAN